MPLWWRLLGRLYAFALRLLPQEKQQTKADDRAGQMAADALDTYGNAILRCAYSYLHNMADAEEVLQDTLLKLLTAAPNFESEEHKGVVPAGGGEPEQEPHRVQRPPNLRRAE